MCDEMTYNFGCILNKILHLISQGSKRYGAKVQ